MKIGFHSEQLGLRGTEVALYDYALANKEILGNESFIFAPKNNELTTYDKFSSKFPVYLYENFKELEDFNLDWCYFIKYGFNDGKLLSSSKNFVHAVFDVKDPHGDVYAYVSEWLGDKHHLPFLPHIVSPPPSTPNYRPHFNIPEDAVVFGRHGGYDQFDYKWVYPVIEQVLESKENVYFIFLNTKRFSNHPRIIHFSPTYDVNKKAAFISTCDAMLHARSEGESFGLAMCEFLSHNKPVITNPNGRDKNHVEVLKDKGLFYTNPEELYNILTKFVPTKKDYVHLIKQFSPEKVMDKFKNYTQ